MADSSSKTRNSDGFSPFVAACFILNYMIGTGFLTLPWAFNKAGLLLSSITMVIICAVGIISVDYEIIALARANILRDNEEKDEGERLFNSSEEFGYGSSDCAVSTDEGKSLTSTHPVLITSESYVVNQLCRIFMGVRGFRLYTFCISLNLFGELSAYSCVFASALSTSLPIFESFDKNYGLYIIVFSSIVIPISMMELKEQVCIQIFLSGCRIFMFIIMISSTLFATLNGDFNKSITPIFDEQYEAATSNWLDFSGLKQMLPIVVFSSIVQQSVPQLAAAISDSRQIGLVFRIVFILCGSCYIMMACSVAWFFGDEVEQSSNINWLNFELKPYFLGNIISLYVVLFPALDVISAFPLNSVVLGSSLMAAAVGGTHDSAYVNNRTFRMAFRLLACIPPLLTAYFCRSLGIITAYAGLSGLIIALPFPAVLFIKSASVLREKGLPVETFYDRFGSDTFTAVLILIFGVTAIGFCSYLLLTS